MPHILQILPNGTVTGLYTEVIPLASLGPMTMRRASNIEFNATTQEWEVRTANDETVLFCNASRQACLEWERDNADLLQSYA